jgi:2-polyprenyl-3-methyl-5-hydroxy-6-metoxy-1,4-benzoquinol methylase
MINISEYPAIVTLTNHIVSRWPEHSSFLEKSFAGRTGKEFDVSESLARAILLLAEDESGGLDQLCDDYRFLCEHIVLPEEIYFRRNGTYRLTSFEDAQKECYANAQFMARYMNGLLLSDVMWVNHASAFAYFVDEYLPRLRDKSNHLEIGPGHGLFLYFAASANNVVSVTGWDISPTSIEKTRHALTKLAAPIVPQLHLQNMFDADSIPEKDRFSSVVMSEILEHLEDPSAALLAAAEAMTPGGYIFINVPANSPAPDHIFLFESLAHTESIVTDAGLIVVASQAFPMSGATLERAMKHKLAVSCVVIAQKPA